MITRRRVLQSLIVVPFLKPKHIRELLIEDEQFPVTGSMNELRRRNQMDVFLTDENGFYVVGPVRVRKDQSSVKFQKFTWNVVVTHAVLTDYFETRKRPLPNKLAIQKDTTEVTLDNLSWSNQ